MIESNRLALISGIWSSFACMHFESLNHLREAKTKVKDEQHFENAVF